MHLTKFLFLKILFCSIICTGWAQDAPFIKRTLNLGLVPGIGSNGIDPKNYVNAVSVNLISSYSSANKGFEAAGLSSFHSHHSSGLQVAGVANVIGGNRKEKRKYTVVERNQFNADFTGVQVSGATNVVTGDVIGFQLAGGWNVSKHGSVTGAQISGLLNFSSEYTTGLQVGGLINISKKAVSGVQLSTLLNTTEGDLYGLQGGLWNTAENIYGIRSSHDLGSGYQIGAFNVSRDLMGGLQIGLINGATTVTGLQIGLVNINRETKGYPIALVTLGVGRTGLKISYDNISPVNVQFLTGSKHITNSVVLGYEIQPEYKRPLVGYSIGHTSFLSGRSMFNHLELLVRTMNVDFRNFKFTPLYTVQDSFAIHFYHGFYVYAAVGMHYDVRSYFPDRGQFFPAYSFGLAGLY